MEHADAETGAAFNRAKGYVATRPFSTGIRPASGARHEDDRVRIEDCLGKIGASSRHLFSLINDVLDMSKIEDGKLTVNRTPFYLKQVLDSVTNIIYPRLRPTEWTSRSPSRTWRRTSCWETSCG